MSGGGALLLLRHGQSVSNAADVFTGWHDAASSELGAVQARGRRRLVRYANLPADAPSSVARCRAL